MPDRAVVDDWPELTAEEERAMFIYTPPGLLRQELEEEDEPTPRPLVAISEDRQWREEVGAQYGDPGAGSGAVGDGVAVMESQRSCFNRDGTPKKRFVTSHRADWVAWKMMKRWGDSLESYQCPVCNGFHLGHAGERS